MKKYMPSIVFGCLGICLGFSLCYVRLVLPERISKLDAPQPFIQKVAMRRNADGQVVYFIPGTKYMLTPGILPDNTKPF